MIVVTGVTGSGKSTLCARAQAALEDGYNVVNFGSTMAKIAKDSGLADSISALRTSSATTYRRVMLDACDEVAGMDRKTLLDTRCLIVSNQGYLPGLPAEILLNLGPTQIILVEANPADILARRARRTSDDKPWYSRQGEAEVALQQELARAYAVSGSFATGVPLCLITNNDGQLEEAQSRLVKAVHENSWEIHA